MRFRNLRIAWSAFCGVVAMLLLLLTVHTNHYQVQAGGWASKSHFIKFVSFKQWMQMYVASLNREWPPHLRSMYVEKPDPLTAPVRKWYIGQGIEPGSIAEIKVSLWLWVAIVAMFGALPWSPKILMLRRFSLRTLLIATTLVAVVLRLAIYAASSIWS